MNLNTKTPRAQDSLSRYLPETTELSGTAPGPMQIFDLQYLRALMWRQRYILAGVTALALLLGLVITLLTTPTYQAHSTVRVAEAGMIVEGQDISEPYIHPNMIYEYMTTLGQVVTSRSMAERVADSLELGEDPGKVPGLAEAAQDGQLSDPGQFAAAILAGGVSVEVPPDSQIMTITFTSTDPAFASLAANAYAQNFVLENIDQATSANAYAREYLEKEIADVRGQLGEAEKQAIDYARSNRILGEPLGMQAADGSETGIAPTVTAASLMSMNQAYNEARARRIEAEQRWRAVSGIPAAQLPEVQQAGNIQSMQARVAELQSQLADLRERYREDYPAVREATAEIASIRQEIANESAQIKAGIRSQFMVAQRQEAGLRRELAQASDATLDEQDRRVQYNFINRDVAALRNQLDTLMQRYNQISAAANLRTSRVTLLDRAQVPSSPSSPNLLKNLLIALVLGGGAAFGIAVLREIFDNRMRSIEDVESKLGLPALGQTPFIEDRVDSEIEDSFSPISEAYSSIRASLDFALLSPNQKVIQFTSSEGGEGKSTSCAAIARKYAMVGKRVLLIDMDLRRPSMQKAFGTVRPRSGIVDVLYSRTPLADAIMDVGVPGLDLLPVSEIPTNPVEILSSGLVAELLQRVTQTYDIVLIDSSPVLGIADAPLLSRFVDAVVFVVEANRANARQARAAVRRLQDMDAHLVGAIVTKYRALEAGQSYDYQYRYYTYSEDKG